MGPRCRVPMVILVIAACPKLVVIIKLAVISVFIMRSYAQAVTGEHPTPTPAENPQNAEDYVGEPLVEDEVVDLSDGEPMGEGEVDGNPWIFVGPKEKKLATSLKRKSSSLQRNEGKKRAKNDKNKTASASFNEKRKASRSPFRRDGLKRFKNDYNGPRHMGVPAGVAAKKPAMKVITKSYLQSIIRGINPQLPVWIINPRHN